MEGENPILMAGVVACDEKALVEAVDRSAPPGFGLALLVTAGRGDDSEKGQTAWHRPARN